MWNDYVASSDYLFYKPYASIIAKAAMDRTKSPMTIGVFGTWGTGKSTLLAMVKDEIENQAKDKGTLCIRLNAWTFEGYDDAKTALMEALIESLEDKKPFLPYREKIKSIISHLDLMKISSIAVNAGLPLALRLLMGATGGTFVSVNTKNPADTLTEALPKISNEISQAAGANTTMQSIRKFREEMESLLQTAEVENIVVLLDDLDRCMPDAIMDMLEAIRLFLTIPKLTFVVAADDAIIKYAVNRKYPDKDKLNLNLADEYVEKMFHYPIYIPGLSNKDIENHLLLLAARKHLDDESYGRIIQELHETGRILDKNRIEMSEISSMIVRMNLPLLNGQAEFLNDMQITDQIRALISRSLNGNPRKAKHFMNTLEMKLNLGELYFGKTLRKDVLAKLMALREIDPNLFLTLYGWNQGFTIENNEMKKMTEAVFGNPEGTDYPEWRKPLVLQWLCSQPLHIYRLRLDRYFYLFRESLPVPGSPMILQEARTGDAPNLSEAADPALDPPTPKMPVQNLPAESSPTSTEDGRQRREAEDLTISNEEIGKLYAAWNLVEEDEKMPENGDPSSIPDTLEELLIYPI